jgi:hypothetical protein
LESDQATKRPSYYALQSFITALKDATWNAPSRRWEGGDFTPKALLFTLDGAPRTLKSVTLQKQNGEYFLLIWNELPVCDSRAKRAMENPPVTVTINFQNLVEGVAQVLRQDETGAFRPADWIESWKPSIAERWKFFARFPVKCHVMKKAQFGSQPSRSRALLDQAIRENALCVQRAIFPNYSLVGAVLRHLPYDGHVSLGLSEH